MGLSRNCKYRADFHHSTESKDIDLLFAGCPLEVVGRLHCSPSSNPHKWVACHQTRATRAHLPRDEPGPKLWAFGRVRPRHRSLQSVLKQFSGLGSPWPVRVFWARKGHNNCLQALVPFQVEPGDRGVVGTHGQQHRGSRCDRQVDRLELVSNLAGQLLGSL